MDGKYKVQLYKAGRHPQCTEVLGEGGGGDSEIIEFYLSGNFQLSKLRVTNTHRCTETITGIMPPLLLQGKLEKY